jgi:ATP-dependent DNA helicase PIF1
MYFVHPSDSEKFSLRLLLIHKRGVKSFADLRTVKGITYETFHEAAVHMGLIDGNNELDYMMKEACNMITDNNQLRELFCVVLLHCQPSKPSELWNNYKKNLYDDYLYGLRKSMPSKSESELHMYCENLCLYEVDCILQRSGKRINKFVGIPTFDTN